MTRYKIQCIPGGTTEQVIHAAPASKNNENRDQRRPITFIMTGTTAAGNSTNAAKMKDICMLSPKLDVLLACPQ